MKIQSLLCGFAYSAVVLISAAKSNANIPTTVIPPTAPVFQESNPGNAGTVTSNASSASIIPSQPPISEIKSARLPTPDFDADLNGLAGIESQSREGQQRQGKLKAAIRKQN